MRNLLPVPLSSVSEEVELAGPDALGEGFPLGAGVKDGLGIWVWLDSTA